MKRFGALERQIEATRRDPQNLERLYELGAALERAGYLPDEQIARTAFIQYQNECIRRDPSIQLRDYHVDMLKSGIFRSFSKHFIHCK